MSDITYNGGIATMTIYANPKPDNPGATWIPAVGAGRTALIAGLDAFTEAASLGVPELTPVFYAMDLLGGVLLGATAGATEQDIGAGLAGGIAASIAGIVTGVAFAEALPVVVTLGLAGLVAYRADQAVTSAYKEMEGPLGQAVIAESDAEVASSESLINGIASVGNAIQDFATQAMTQIGQAQIAEAEATAAAGNALAQTVGQAIGDGVQLQIDANNLEYQAQNAALTSVGQAIADGVSAIGSFLQSMAQVHGQSEADAAQSQLRAGYAIDQTIANFLSAAGNAMGPGSANPPGSTLIDPNSSGGTGVGGYQYVPLNLGIPDNIIWDTPARLPGAFEDPAPADGGSGGGGTYGPVVLDLTGKGIKITPLSSSNMFFDLANDGHEQHTAWAGAGNGVLAYDPSGGAVTHANQVNFTLWDPAAKNDMQALEDVFDTNHDGTLNASDASWSSFRILVTNADGTTTLETLAQAGVTSINLQANAYQQSLPDGSSIDGETSFTRSDGTTGTAAAVSFATSGDYVVQQSVTQNSAGATVLENSAYTPDGQLAEQITTTTSANGLDITTTYDWNGDGVIDQTETDDTVVNGDGSTTETVTDTNGSSVVLDSTTTTSANGLVVTIDRDTTGAGYTNQQEVDTRLSTGGSSVSVSDLTRNGSLIDQTVSSVSSDGLTRIVQVDSTGNGSFDLTETGQTVVASNGVRTETVTDSNADGSMRSQTVAVTSADGTRRPRGRPEPLNRTPSTRRSRARRAAPRPTGRATGRPSPLPAARTRPQAGGLPRKSRLPISTPR